ncbi:PREDICTED: uncharacterized protein LOC108968789 [Bactrocera latifrons]|uniref:Uncharacterized protein n=1 Tax=Bactrocera latifrons TaxID=174628 RepID=A0A0K8V6W2_BACLA|nr:PREDICTED: uncharacterized protein LOC108968789 [Bactrocera latifrons]
MSQQMKNKYFIALLLVIGLTSTHATTTTTTEAPAEVPLTPRDQLYEAVTVDYLKLLDYELKESKELVERVLDDDRFQNIRSEILLDKKITLRSYVELVKEKNKKKEPSREYKAARFFYIFGKSLLYTDFIDIVARLEPTLSHYDCWIEDDFMSFGLETFIETLNQKRAKLVRDSVRRIDDYVNGLPPDQQRKATAQKLSDFSVKMKEATEVHEKMVVLKDFLRDYYLETPVEMS